MKSLSVTTFANVVLLLMLSATAHAARIIDTDGAAKALSRGAVLRDIREADAYNKGHIPGAINVGVRVCSQLRTPVRWDYVPIERIDDRLGTWGVDPGRGIVVYADKGSACPYFILVSLELAGAKNAFLYVYDSSRVGYGNRFDLSAENETFFDMFALTNRINTMQQRIDMLEKQLGELRSAKWLAYPGWRTLNRLSLLSG